MKKSSIKSSGGYTLIELLVVVGIIGLISLISVPNFIVLYRSAKMKTSLRNLSADIRNARQTAITRNQKTKVSFVTGLTGTRAYSIWRQNISTTTGLPSWIQYGSGQLEDTIYFSDTTFADDDTPLDGLNDIVFIPNGTIENLPAAPPAIVELKTDTKITPPIRTFTFQLSGQFTIN